MATILPPRNGRFTAQVRLSGFAPAAATFATHKAAVAWAAKKEAELKGLRASNAASRDITRITLKTLCDNYLEDPATKALKSHADSKRLLADVCDKYGTKRCSTFGVIQLREIRTALIKRVKPATVNRTLAVLRSCWNWGIAMGDVSPAQPWPKKLMVPEPRGRVRFLSPVELANVLDKARPDPVMYAAIVTSIACGLRRGELLRLQWADLDFDKGDLTVKVTKTDTPRVVHLPSAAADALKALRKLPVVSPTTVFLTRAGAPLKYPTLVARWVTIRKKAGLKDFRWHDLRHTTASYLVQGGATLYQAGAVLGHLNAHTTQRYAHLGRAAVMPGHDALNELLTTKK